MDTPTFSFEFPQRLRLAAIGCGGHALRNVYPTFAFAPVELVAVCDLDRERAAACGRMFGAGAVYSDYHEMLERERPDAVTVVTNYDAQGRPRYPAITMDALRAGAHVWMEKPPAASSGEIRQMMAVSQETGKFAAVGFKKMFAPANVKASQIIADPEFGPVSTLSVLYPQELRPDAERGNDAAMTGFLDHIVHPLSVVRLLGGPVEAIHVEREARTGATFATLRFRSGALGSVHLCAGASGFASRERTAVFGDGASVVVDNNLRVTYYRRGQPPGSYGRSPTFYGDNDSAPLVWEPEFSLGQLYNKGLFMLGYAPEIRAFCGCVLENRPPTTGSLADALEIMQLYEAYRQPSGQTITLMH